MRIGFLFNHDQVHQVAHSLPIAVALAQSGFAGEIIVATTTRRIAREVRRLAGEQLDARIQHVQLELKSSSAQLTRMVNGVVPAARLLVYRDNLDFFRSLDLLVVAEKTSLVLRNLFGLKRPLLVHTRHGAGDRAIGFDHHSAGFDYVLCSGPKIRDRLVRDAHVPADRITVVGYPKFDIVRPSVQIPHCQPRRPIVLYNPHCSPHLSSWYRHGRAVLDFFRDNDDYQLVFAPHVMLFERDFVVTIDKLRIDRPGALDKRFLCSPGIHVDLGSPACTDMSYTLGADIYLGDASSQVYEFLSRPRPCLFIDSHGAHWRGNPDYEHWNAGPVISHPEQLAEGLKQAIATHATSFMPVQRDMLARSFDLNGQPASVRAALALLQIMDREGLSAPRALPLAA